MTLKNIIAFTTSLMLPAMLPLTTAAWGTGSGGNGNTDDHDRPLFSANELSLDLSGSYIAQERGIEHLFETSIKHNRGTWGGNADGRYIWPEHSPDALLLRAGFRIVF